MQYINSLQNRTFHCHFPLMKNDSVVIQKNASLTAVIIAFMIPSILACCGFALTVYAMRTKNKKWKEHGFHDNCCMLFISVMGFTPFYYISIWTWDLIKYKKRPKNSVVKYVKRPTNSNQSATEAITEQSGRQSLKF